MRLSKASLCAYNALDKVILSLLSYKYQYSLLFFLLLSLYRLASLTLSEFRLPFECYSFDVEKSGNTQSCKILWDIPSITNMMNYQIIPTTT